MSRPLHEAAPQIKRQAEAQVDPLFVERWSRRAFLDQPVPETHIRSVFEAARWAPSSSNLQPWLFVYASTGESLARARTLLKERNLRWAQHAPLLVFVFARRRRADTGEPIRTAQFDTGAAWQSLALQAHRLGLSTRAMGGIHHDQAYTLLGVPADEFESVVAVAIGYPGERTSLPDDLQEREQPSTRRPADEFVFEGRYFADRHSAIRASDEGRSQG